MRVADKRTQLSTQCTELFLNDIWAHKTKMAKWEEMDKWEKKDKWGGNGGMGENR